ELERHWSAVKDWLSQLFIERGIDRISAVELTVPPGMDEVLSLLRLQAHFQSGQWEVIVVDCAPNGETLRLLSLPDVARCGSTRSSPSNASWSLPPPPWRDRS